MANQTCMGAMMQCSQGVAPSSLIPTPKTVMTSNMVAANILDHIPMVNIPPFGMCRSPANPMVAAATAAALGVLTPMPCIPATPAPWVPGAPTVLLCGAPALNDSSKLTCLWAGTISINFAGQVTHQIP
ncbi:MAG: DUF4280 domain-containing protein [Betaproteobacteria bacterium]|jgi:hypothetical protein